MLGVTLVRFYRVWLPVGEIIMSEEQSPSEQPLSKQPEPTAPKPKIPAQPRASQATAKRPISSSESRFPQLSPATLEQLLDRVNPVLQRVQVWWNVALKQFRIRLPESLNQKLSDRALSAIVAGVLVLLFWITSALLPDKPSTVASVPSSRRASPANLSAPAKLSAPQAEKPVKVSPPPEGIESLSPALGLTPEQSLIAAIQEQVAEVTNQYANSLIQSIQANFRESRLIVRVSEGWYELNPSRQDKLANEMLQRSEELAFNQLEITDSEEVLLARSPIVGSRMVILKRH